MNHYTEIMSDVFISEWKRFASAPGRKAVDIKNLSPKQYAGLLLLPYQGKASALTFAYLNACQIKAKCNSDTYPLLRDVCLLLKSAVGGV